MKKFLSCAIVFILVLTMVVPFATMVGAADEPAKEMVLSQEDFKNASAEQLQAYFKPTGWATGAGVSYGETVISYDTTTDMLLMDLSSCTGITGVRLDVPGIDEENTENWMKGMTIEFEIVYVDMNNSNFGSTFVGPYDGSGSEAYPNGTPNVDYTAYFRYYPKDGTFKIVNYNGDNKKASDFNVNCKHVEGDSMKFRVVQDDAGTLYFYSDLGEGEQLCYYYENSELFYTTGYFRFAFRHQDVYGIKNFALYKTPKTEEATEAPTEAITEAPTEATTEAPTEATTENKTENTTAEVEEKSGCGSSIGVMSVALVATAMVPTIVCTRKKRK